MLIEVWRKTYTDKSTQGLLSLNGVFECYSLEPRSDESQGKPFCVPAGQYRYRVGPSAHFNRNVILVDDIPGFTNIEVHPGNFPSDTHGCTLVGRTESTDFVGQSDIEFDSLLSKIPLTGVIEWIDQEEIDAT